MQTKTDPPWVDTLLRWFVKDAKLPFKPVEPAVELPNGMLHAVHEVDGTLVRYHLRIEPDGSGTLIANASAAARLSAYAAAVAAAILKSEDVGDWFTGTALIAASRTDAPPGQNVDGAVIKLLHDLAEPGMRYPIQSLSDPALAPAAGGYRAPLEADVSLPDADRLDLLIDRLWEAGIPHVTFIAPPGFDPTLLVRAVERAEDTGMIAGVRARASELAAGSLLDDLAQAGVDHVNIPYASRDAAVHDALFGEGDHAAVVEVWDILNALEVCPVAEIPLVEATFAGLGALLGELAEFGVSEVECFAIVAPDDLAEADRAGALPPRALPQVAATLEAEAERHGLHLVWAPPVLRAARISLAAQAIAGPRCAGDVAVRIERDGDVIPPRGPRTSAGNILADPGNTIGAHPWEAIWANPAFASYREPTAPPPRCEICSGLAACAAGCPRDPASWAWGVEG